MERSIDDSSGVDTASGTDTVTFRIAESAADKADVVKLREEVYVRDQGRLGDARDTADTFDRFDGNAVYILAADGVEPIGTIKVVPDSAAGLPCEDMVDVAELKRPGNRLVEFGHLMTVPRARGRSVGMALMRTALLFCIAEYAATHVLGDFFAEQGGGLRDFYRQIGFVPVGPAYRDARFLNAPLSVVAVLDLRDAGRRARADREKRNGPLQYFFHDYDDHPRAR
jgi:putrescine aminotransferase